MQIYINGKLTNSRDAKISIFDRGFMYGDGVFESLRTYNRKPFLLNEHLKRLFDAAKKLKIVISCLPTGTANSKAQIPTQIKNLLKINGLNEAYLKIIITRGRSKQHGLSIKNAAQKPTFIIIAEKIAPAASADSDRAGGRVWKIIVVKTARAQSIGAQNKRHRLPIISTIKSLNYLENILAKTEAEKSGADEAIFLDKEGNVLEGTVSNIFIVKNGVLITPPLTLPILPGVTRAYIIKLARQLKIKVREKKFKLKELLAASECFLSFSGEGIVPVEQINQHKFPAGAVSANLRRAFQAAAASA
ncbi:MAG: aminotransferase class IV [Candidatus Margulisiibacteriota bacterium]